MSPGDISFSRFINSESVRNRVKSVRARLASQRDLEFFRSPNFVPTALIVMGSLLILYVVSQYTEMYLEQRRMAEAWEQEQANHGTVSVDAHAQPDSGMMRLVIPKIDLTSFVVEGTTHKALLLGPGHLTHTAEPGELGNSVISAHRDTFFRHIYELEKGDQVFIERGGKKFVYEVTGKKIVEPTDMSVIRQTRDSQVTLITCYPIYYIGPAPKRLVIFSKLAGTEDSRVSDTDNDDIQPLPHVQATSMGAAH